jgi:hypothetical protein
MNRFLSLIFVVGVVAGCQDSMGPSSSTEPVVAPSQVPSKVETASSKVKVEPVSAKGPAAAYRQHLKLAGATPLDASAQGQVYQLLYVPRASKNRYIVRLWKDEKGYHYQSFAPGTGRGKWIKPKWIDFLRAIRSGGYWEQPTIKVSSRPGSEAWIEAVKDGKHHLVYRVRPTGEFGRAVQLMFMSAASKHGAAPVLEKK